jgi:Ulp1 family protease
MSIIKKLIQCLNPSQPDAQQWLNDSVINFYLELLNRSVLNKHHIFMENLSPTRVSSEVTKFSYSNVSIYSHYKTRKNVYIFQKDIVLITINYHGQHWTLAVIYKRKQEVAYYDSVNNSNQKAGDYLHIIH